MLQLVERANVAAHADAFIALQAARGTVRNRLLIALMRKQQYYHINRKEEPLEFFDYIHIDDDPYIRQLAPRLQTLHMLDTLKMNFELAVDSWLQMISPGASDRTEQLRHLRAACGLLSETGQQETKFLRWFLCNAPISSSSDAREHALWALLSLSAVVSVNTLRFLVEAVGIPPAMCLFAYLSGQEPYKSHFLPRPEPVAG